MRVLQGIPDGTVFANPILTIGTFDGVHQGHQAIISSLVAKAKAEGKESVLFTFHPHPRMVLYPESHSVRLIDTVEEKLEKLEKLGLDTVILFPFTKEFSRLTAMEFVRDILVGKIGVSEMVVGYDHHFGKNREGSFQELQELGKLYGFEVNETKAVLVSDIAVSSTKIRKAILEGDTLLAVEFMRTPFVISGTVVHGNKLGRTIGFPTANVSLDQTVKLLPAIGVYAVRIRVKGTLLDGVMNIGHRPTLQNDENIFVEVFIFDFNEEIYDEEVRIQCFDRLRGEHKFESVDALKNQLNKDVEMAKLALHSKHSTAE